MFLIFLGFAMFQLLGLLKLNHSINWPWVIIIVPLEVSLALISVIAFRKGKPILMEHVPNVYIYTAILVILVLATKTGVGLITVAALTEYFPAFIPELNFLAILLIALLIGFVPLTIFYYQPLAHYSKRLPLMMIQNQILLCTFFVFLVIRF